MFQGTGSDVGKSLIVAGLCRLYARRGLRVRPFKPQNMSNNAAVTHDGGEIGRAQALQARASGVPPSVHMNPVLLKPQSETGSQVVVQGRVLGPAKAREYQTLKPKLMDAVLGSFACLREEADLVLVEGAGSAAEINLRDGDIANMGFARAAGCPVILIGDIDRGGIFAQILGVKAALPPDDAATIFGFIVNKFRGDASLLADGMATIAERTGWRALRPLAFLSRRGAPAGGGRVRPGGRPAARGRGRHDRRADARSHRQFRRFRPAANGARGAARVRPRRRAAAGVSICVILPGSKATVADLAFFRAQGWEVDLLAHVRRGGRVLGICGGYQMLGRSVADPNGIEGPAGAVAGLDLLDVKTVLTGEKTLERVEGECVVNAAPFAGYEMHVGRTSGPDCLRPLLRFSDGRTHGAVSGDGRVAGAYVHGLFADDRQRAAWLASLGAASGLAYETTVERTLDSLAEHLEQHLDCDAMLKTAR